LIFSIRATRSTVKFSFVSAVSAALAIAISACGGGQDPDVAPAKADPAGPVELAPLVTRVEAYQTPATMQARNAAASPRGEGPSASAVKLAPPAAARRADAGRTRGGPGVPAQVGIAREVPATRDRAAMARTMRWHQRPNGGAAGAVSFTSEGAAGLRIGLLVHKLPPEAVVRGYVQGGETEFEIAGGTILEAIRRNRDAGDVSDDGRTYWTPVVDGEEVTVEIVLPPGMSGDVVDLSIPRLSHLYVRADDFGTAKAVAASCNVDVSCVNEPNASQSTALMVYTGSDGRSYSCTGTLVNDSASSGTPYFLSANHCISTQTSASSLNTRWFYRSTSCNSGVPDSRNRWLIKGATLLYASSATDTSFMRLNEPPPPGALYAGWTITAPSLGEAVIGIHHPLGDLQKFNQGSVSGFANCNPGTAPSTFSCSTSSQSSGRNFVMSTWIVGTTESGSSGSGLFSTLGGSRYLIGQLYGGSASCTTPNGADAYGRLDVAYHAALSRWLSAAGVTPRTPIHRFYNGSTGAHFFTSSAAERDWVIVAYPAFNYEGVAFYAYTSPVAGASPVYRFFNTRNGRHFYTISAAERDIVLATYPEFSYEGVSWYAQPASGGNANAVYRFFNAGLGTHFYTISEAEKDWVRSTIPAYAFEGVGYYAWITQ
jgi:lysyl endopeptidase